MNCYSFFLRFSLVTVTFPILPRFLFLTAQSSFPWPSPSLPPSLFLGHQGGVAFGKNPAGKLFLDWFGENLVRREGGGRAKVREEVGGVEVL